MSDPGFIAQQLNLLLTAGGYNLYNSENRARADDLLVREQACAALGQAANRLSKLAADYNQRFIPPSTREQPFPPADKMAQLRDLKALFDEVSLLSSRIRGMSVPTQDKVWAKFRREADMLHRLLSFDYQLISQARALDEWVEPLTVEAWTPAHPTELRRHLHELEMLAREREKFLVAV